MMQAFRAERIYHITSGKSDRLLVSNNPGLRKTDWPLITFKSSGSVHFDKCTYSIKGKAISLFTTEGRIIVPMKLGEFQGKYLDIGIPKEAELVCRKGRYYFNLVLDFPDPPKRTTGPVAGVDLGENTIAAISTGKIFGAASSGMTATNTLPFVPGFNATALNRHGNC